MDANNWAELLFPRQVIHKDAATKEAEYRYGAMLASHGIGIDELAEDWPEVLLCMEAMRGYRGEPL